MLFTKQICNVGLCLIIGDFRGTIPSDIFALYIHTYQQIYYDYIYTIQLSRKFPHNYKEPIQITECLQ